MVEIIEDCETIEDLEKVMDNKICLFADGEDSICMFVNTKYLVNLEDTSIIGNEISIDQAKSIVESLQMAIDRA